MSKQEAVYFYIVGHHHEEGDDVYMIWSYSPDLDRVDLAVADRVCFDLDNDVVVIEPVPDVVNERLNGPVGDVEDLTGTIQSFRKATSDERKAYFSSLDFDAVERLGLGEEAAA